MQLGHVPLSAGRNRERIVRHLKHRASLTLAHLAFPRRYLSHIEAGYLPNPYHNKTHAAHVLHRTHMLLHYAGFVPHYADKLTLLGCYMAAVRVP